MKRFRFKIFLVLFFLLLTPSLRAYELSSVNVPIDDPVYRDIDKLAAFGLADDVIYGQRPWSRDEIARLIEKAVRQREEWGQPLTPDNREIETFTSADELLERLKSQFHEELIDRDAIEGDRKSFRFHPLHYLDAQYTLLESDPRPVPPQNGLAAIDAVVNPLVANDEGRHYPKGHQFSIETEHYLRASPYFSFYARPRFEADITNSGNGSVNVFAQQLYGKFSIHNFELEAGRDSLEWGQGEFGGILLSNNARPLDMIKLSNPSPLIPPWIFKYLGPIRYTFFIANMGPEREFPYSFLTGLKFTFKPASFLEFGFSKIMMLGGDGAPGPITFGQILRDAFIMHTGAERQNISNREAGLDARFFLPALRNTQFYLEVQFEDSDSSVKYLLGHLSSYQTGIYIPRLGNTGSVNLRLEYRHGSPYFYRHAFFVTGMTLNEKILGDELGPSGNGMYATLTADATSKLQLRTTLQYEIRGGSTYDETLNPRRLITVTPSISEKRFGWLMSGTYDFERPMRLMLGFGYERINAFNFASGDNRNAFLAKLGMRFDLF